MRNRRILLAAFPLAFAGVVLAGCSVVNADTADTGSSTSSTDAATGEATSDIAVDTTGDLAASAVLAANADVTVVRDDEWDAATAVNIDLAADSPVTITKAGVYRLSGTTTSGVTVSAPDDAQVVLILDSVSITASSGAAINVVSADDVAINLAAGTTNTLSAPGDDETANAAVYADTDLTISGSGALTVTGGDTDGIAATDDLAIIGGTVTVTTGDDGLRGKDALLIEDGTVNITAGGDALKSDRADDETAGYVAILGGTITATAGDDAIAATTDIAVTGGTISLTAGGGAGTAVGAEESPRGLVADGIIALDGGTITVDAADDGIHSNGAIGIGAGTVTVAAGDDGIHADVRVVIGGGEVTVSQSNEALESGDITIAGGTVDLTASDDGINASAGTTTTTGGGGGGGMQDSGETLLISGGTVTVNADGDGLDSNGSLEITGGDIVVYGPVNDGNGALDANGGITMSGGTLLALGSSGMAETPDAASAQAWVATTLSGAAGDELTITAADGTVLATATSAKQFSSAVFSSPDVAASTEYTFAINGSQSATVTSGTAIAGGMGGGPGGGQGGGRRP